MLDSFWEKKREYEQACSDFDKFAKGINKDYAHVMSFRRSLFIFGGVCVLLALMILFFKIDIGIEVYPRLWFILGCVSALVGTALHANERDVIELTNQYIAENNLPKEDKELAFWIFARKQDFSKFPFIQDMLMRNLISESDLDGFHIGFDSDDDFDSDD